MPSPYAGHATTSVGLTGDYRIDELVGGRKWEAPAGTDVELSFSFPADDSVFAYGGYHLAPGYRGFDQAERDAFRDAASSWAAVADIGFTEIAETGSDVGVVRAAVTDGIGSAAGAAFQPSGAPSGGDLWLGTSTVTGSLTTMQPGGYAHKILLHELGHVLGLGDLYHRPASFSADELSSRYTVMALGNTGNVGINPQTPMLYDVLAIQHLYGANDTHNADDTLYTFAPDHAHFLTIWDAGGDDTLDASDQVLPVDVDLRAGAFSSVGIYSSTFDQWRATDNVAIAYGAIIENAVGSAHADTLTGNDTANVLSGNSGDDDLRGNGGDDRLDGGAGIDTAWYALAAAAYEFATTDDGAVVIRAPTASGEGVDTITAVEWFAFADERLSRADLERLATDPDATNTPPRAAADAGTAVAGATLTIDVLANDSDPDGEALRLVAWSEPELGSIISASAGSLEYLASTAGLDVFSYTVEDGQGGTATGRVEIEVVAPAPTLPTPPSVTVTHLGTADRDFLRGDGRAERFELEGGDDWGFGGDGDDQLIGGNGRDILFGDAGDDWLDGGDGRDTLYGRDGNDRLVGGAGGDYLKGGSGDDWLAVDGGDDRIRTEAGADLVDLRALGGANRLYDFTPGVDRLVLDAAAMARLDDDRPGGDGRLTAADSAATERFGDLTLTFGDDATITIHDVTAIDAADLLLMA